MIDTLSTSSIILLARSIDDLEHYVDWVITSSGLVITIVIALFVAIQFSALRKVQDQELREIKLEIKKDNELFIASTKDVLVSAVKDLEEKQDRAFYEIRQDITDKLLGVNVDISRLFAVYAEQQGLLASSFRWWLSAAASSISLGYDENMINISLNTAIEIASREDIKKETSQIMKDLQLITEYISKIKSSRPIQGELLEKKLRGIIGLEDSTKSDIPASTQLLLETGKQG